MFLWSIARKILKKQKQKRRKRRRIQLWCCLKTYLWLCNRWRKLDFVWSGNEKQLTVRVNWCSKINKICLNFLVHKVLQRFFFCVCVFTAILEDNRTTTDWYMNVCLPEVIDNIRKQRVEHTSFSTFQCKIVQCISDYQLFEARKNESLFYRFIMSQ